MRNAPSFSAATVTRLHASTGFLLWGTALTLVYQLLLWADGSFVAFLAVIGSILLLIGLASVRGALREMLTSAPQEEQAEQRQPQQKQAPVTSVAQEDRRPSQLELEGMLAVKRTKAAKEKPAQPAWTQTIDWEEWVGKKLLQKAGILIVLIGMFVFLKYSFDNGWVDELGRTVLAALVGTVLLVLGEVFQKKFAQWAQGFTGSGLALFYLTVWVAHVLYAPILQSKYGIAISPTMALVLYSGITAVGAFASIRYKSPIIAWFALGGGYLTPLLIDAPTSSPIMLSAYLGILALGLLALSLKQNWKVLHVVSFFCTQLYLFLNVYRDIALANNDQILIAIGFFLVFNLLPLAAQFGQKVKAKNEDIVLIGCNTLALFLPVMDALGGWQSEYVTYFSLALAALYVVYAGAAVKLRSDDILLCDAYVLGGIGFIALALYHQMGWQWAAAGWAPYAILLVLLAMETQRSRVWEASKIILLGSLLLLIMNLPMLHATAETIWRPFTSNWSIQSYIVFASVVGLLFLQTKLPAAMLGAPEVVKRRTSAFHVALALIAFAFVTFEATSLHWVASLPLAYSYLVFAAAAMAVYLWTAEEVWLGAAFVAQALVLIFTFVTGPSSGMFALSNSYGSASVMPFFHPWALVSLLSMVVMAGFVLLVQRGKSPATRDVRLQHLLRGIIIAEIWLHFTVEIRNMTMAWDWSTLTYHRALSVWWVIMACVICYFARTNGWRRAGIVLLAVPLLKDLARIIGDGSVPFSDTIAWSVALLVIAAVAAHAKRRELLTSTCVMLGALTAVDMVSHLTFRESGLVRSVWWAFAALLAMGAGFVEREKVLRTAAIGMFAGTTIKLLLFDFSVLSTPVRIVASIATGLLMIGASYLYQRYSSRLNS